MSAPVRIPSPLAQVARGFAMGTADIVPGVSGGTVALVLGIYGRLIRNVHAGAQLLGALVARRRVEIIRRWATIEWVWLLSLLVGILAAIAVLSSILTRLLDEQPVRTSALFFGLVAGAVVVAWRLVRTVTAREIGLAIVMAVALFLVLGLRSDTESGAEEAVTQPVWIFFLAGALAICAMILPGISGSLILVMIGMYHEVLGAVTERNLAALGATVLGCVIGLALFSTLLNWLLEHHHDLVMAAMVGLMLGSLRVLWPWPGGTSTTELASPSGDVAVPIILVAVGVAVVFAVEYLAQRFTSDASR